jgi:hypothetical protein
MPSALSILTRQWATSCERLRGRLVGLTDDELRWELATDCWNVRPSPSSPTGWSIDYPPTAPDPPPFTTIAWRLLHVADGNTIYWEHAFGPGVLNFWDLAPQGDATSAIEYLEASQRPITDTLAHLSDAHLDELRPTQFGEPWPAHRVLTTLIDEQVHHGAEIALLRDLYRIQFPA